MSKQGINLPCGSMPLFQSHERTIVNPSLTRWQTTMAILLITSCIKTIVIAGIRSCSLCIDRDKILHALKTCLRLECSQGFIQGRQAYN